MRDTSRMQEAIDRAALAVAEAEHNVLVRAKMWHARRIMCGEAQEREAFGRLSESLEALFTAEVTHRVLLKSTSLLPRPTPPGEETR